MEQSDLAERRLLLQLPCNYQELCHYASAWPCKSRALERQVPKHKTLNIVYKKKNIKKGKQH